ncbi:MAG: RNA pyrophosphohydrolase [Rhodospirillaceae bacterium]|nr:RNA pyrophosphohydrolase [Rhodospirillaceae bacterium]
MTEDSRPYRPCVGVMLLNLRGHVCVGNRIDMAGENWQMPQGGIDDGETPRDAALRELEEEAGTRKAEIIAESREWFSYDLPETVSRQLWGGRFRGQTQRWFAMRFSGEDDDIQLNRHKAEFSAWRWVPMGELEGLIAPMKRAVYVRVIREFAHLGEAADGEAG